MRTWKTLLVAALAATLSTGALARPPHHGGHPSTHPARPVPPPPAPVLAPLTVVNDGQAPLLVSVGPPSAGVWVVPGQPVVLDVPVGRTVLTTSVWTFEGLVELERRPVVVTFGGRCHERVGLTADARSWVTLTNHERRAITVYVDGRAVATVPPWSSRGLDLPPGRHLVAVVDERGRLLYHAPTFVHPRTDYDVQIAGGVTVTPMPEGRPVAWRR